MREVVDTYCAILKDRQKLGKFDITESSIKKHIFMFYHSIITNCSIPFWLYTSVLLIEAIQIIYPLVYESPDDGSLASTLVLFNSYPSNLLTYSIYICASLVFWGVGFLLMAIINTTHLGKTFIVNSLLPKIYGYILFHYDCVLLLTSTISLSSVFSCSIISVNKSVECYSITHYIMMIASVVVIFLSLLGEGLGIIFVNVYFDEPGIPFARRSIYVPILKLCTKLVIALTLVLNVNIVYIVGYLVALVCSAFNILIITKTNYYTVAYIEIGCQTVICWMLLFKIISLIATLHIQSFVLWIPCILLIWVMGYVKNLTSMRIASTFGTLWMKPSEFVTRCINEITFLLLSSNKKNLMKSNVINIGLVYAHKRVCAIQGCNCEKAFAFVSTEKAGVGIAFKSKSQSFSALSNENLQNIKEKDLLNFQNYASSIVLSALTHWEYFHIRESKICIQKSLVNDRFLNKRFKALFELSRAELLKPTILDQFAVFSLKSRIFKKITQNEGKETINSKFSILTIVRYHTAYIKMHKAIASSLEITKNFWSELKLAKPNFNAVMKLSEDQFVKSAKIRHQKNLLESLCNHDLRGSVIYALYLSIIDQDRLAAIEQSAKVKSQFSLNKLIYDDLDKNYGPNSSVSVVIIGGNEEKQGNIIDSNNETTNLFGYTRHDIINCSINSLMPFAISKYHNGFLSDCFDKDEHMLLKGSSIDSVALHSRGYIFPVSIIAKVKYSIGMGIVCIGFIKASASASFPKDAYVMLLDENQIIEALNFEFIKLISNASDATFIKYIASEKKPCISRIFPHAFHEETLAGMCSMTGVIEPLDLNSLRLVIASLNGMNDQATDEKSKAWEQSIKELCANSEYLLKLNKVTNGILIYYLLSISIFSSQSTIHTKLEDTSEGSQILENEDNKLKKDAIDDNTQSVTSNTSSKPIISQPN